MGNNQLSENKLSGGEKNQPFFHNIERQKFVLIKYASQICAGPIATSCYE